MIFSPLYVIHTQYIDEYATQSHVGDSRTRCKNTRETALTTRTHLRIFKKNDILKIII